MAAIAQHVGATRQGAQQPFFRQAGEVILPKGHILLKAGRGAVRLVFEIGFVAGARLAEVGAFTAGKGRVNIGNNRNMKKDGQPVEHDVRALDGNDAACRARKHQRIADKGILYRLFKELVDHAVGGSGGVRLRGGIKNPKVGFVFFTIYEKAGFFIVLTQDGGGQRREVERMSYGLTQQLGVEHGVYTVATPDGCFCIVGQRRLCREPQFLLTTG